MQGSEFKSRPPPKKLIHKLKKTKIENKVLLASAFRTLVKEFFNRNFILKIQVFIFVLTMITPFFDANLL
jgi:hypothetical protein